MSTAPAIDVSGLTKRYPAPLLRRAAPTEALRDVSFALAAGEVLAVIGPNGSGKSTLLKILSGILLPTAGTARVGGLDVVADRPRSRGAVGLAASDDRGLSPRLTIRENLRFFGALYGVETNDRTRALAQSLECAHLLDRPVRNLSSGERARGALMRALLHEPRVLLVDELTRALDPGAASRIRRWLRESGLTLVVASHDLSEVESIADRVVLLDRGSVAAQGCWSEVRRTAEAVFARVGEA